MASSPQGERLVSPYVYSADTTNDLANFSDVQPPQPIDAADVDLWKHFPGTSTSLIYSGNEYDLYLDWIFSTDMAELFNNAPEQPQFLVPPEVPQQAPETNALRGRHLLHDSSALSLPVPDAQERFGPDDATVGPAAPLSHFSLPPLSLTPGFELYTSFFTTKPISSSTRELMQSWLRLPLEKGMWDNVSLSAFPSKEKLDHCIDLFFAQWDRHCPVVHRPTFDPAREPVVTLAMATLGACYTGFEGAQPWANALSELVRRLLIFMEEQDPRFVRTEHHVTAQLLQAAYGFSSGNRRLFELSESSRAQLVNHGRRMGLFSSHESTCPPTASLEERWHAWVRDERFRRLGWGIYVWL